MRTLSIRSFNILLFLTMNLFHNSLHAETKVGDQFGDWIFGCRAVTAEKTVCALAQTIINSKNNHRLVSLSIRKNSTGEGTILTTILPLGIYLPAGASVTIKSAKNQANAIPLSIQACGKQGCFATSPIDSKLLNAMKLGDKLEIAFTIPPNNKPLVVSGSLKGFSEGIKSIGVK